MSSSKLLYENTADPLSRASSLLIRTYVTFAPGHALRSSLMLSQDKSPTPLSTKLRLVTQRDLFWSKNFLLTFLNLNVIARTDMLLAKIALGIFSILAFAFYFFLIPPRHPLNVPSVPFWVVLLPFFWDVDQETTYRQYIEKPLIKHGAVKIFFGGQWCLLVQRPSFMMEVLRNEEVYQKSGNQKKIPHSVLAEFLGI